MTQGNVPSANAQFYSNDTTLRHFARCAKIFQAWEFYRRQLVKVLISTIIVWISVSWEPYIHARIVLWRIQKSVASTLQLWIEDSSINIFHLEIISINLNLFIG